MNKTLLGALTCAAALMLSACQTSGTGTGSGNVRGTRKPVAFTWESTDSTSGTITATFGSGRVFRGNYFQITRDTRVERLDPLWDGWGRPYRRNSWRYWDRNSETQFVKTYSGRVLANLADERGEHMRCRFTLISPARGMAGGGEGRCELSDSPREINAEFPRQG
jgi:hypothetical protein